MNVGLIATRYAKALFDFSLESATQEKVYGEMKLLKHMFSTMNDLATILDNPVIDKEQKKKVILTAGGIKVSATFDKFIDLLLKNNRENYLHNIVLKFLDIYRKHQGILYGKLITAVEVDKATEQKIRTLATEKLNKKLELEKIVDPSIIGGFLMEVEDVRWDASIKNQLLKIKNECIERNKRIV